MGKQAQISYQRMTIRKVQFVIVSLILFPLLLLQSSSGALTLSDTPPWDDLEKALLQLAGAEAEFESSERKIEEKERELSDLLRAEDKEEALEISFLLEMKEAEDLTKELAIEAFMGGDSMSSAAYLLDSENVGDLIFRRAILLEATEAVEKQSQDYAEMREAASASMLDIADQIDDLLADILDEKGRRTQAEEKILRAEHVVTIAQIHASADVLKAERGRVEPTAEQWRKLRFCESTEQYDISTGNGYYGAYQFDLITWVGVGGEGDPSEAPPEEQDARARYLYHLNGWYPWPVCGRFLPQ
tara:strand:- start:503 stop:1408 length:906 start_codon:yes stop_codon:yes gene_type:complete